jgi:hypothetical protein
MPILRIVKRYPLTKEQKGKLLQWVHTFDLRDYILHNNLPYLTLPQEPPLTFDLVERVGPPLPVYATEEKMLTQSSIRSRHFRVRPVYRTHKHGRPLLLHCAYEG